MKEKVAVVGILVENPDSVEELNAILHEYNQYIIGRMGIPYRKKSIHVISVVIDAPQNVVATLSEKIEKLQGVSVKAVFAKTE